MQAVRDVTHTLLLRWHGKLLPTARSLQAHELVE